jgi:hypothetical protein
VTEAYPAQVWLSNIPAGHDLDLVLRDDTLEEIASSKNWGTTPEYLAVVSLSPGRYYIQVVRFEGTGSTQPYHLVAEFGSTE